MITVKKAGIVLTTATIALLSMQPQAEARWRGAWPFVAGAVAGAAIGTIATSPYYYGYGSPYYGAYGYPYGYGPTYTYAPRYAYRAPYYGLRYAYPECHYFSSRNFEVWDRERFGC